MIFTASLEACIPLLCPSVYLPNIPEFPSLAHDDPQHRSAKSNKLVELDSDVRRFVASSCRFSDPSENPYFGKGLAFCGSSIPILQTLDLLHLALRPLPQLVPPCPFMSSRLSSLFLITSYPLPTPDEFPFREVGI